MAEGGDDLDPPRTSGFVPVQAGGIDGLSLTGFQYSILLMLGWTVQWIVVPAKTGRLKCFQVVLVDRQRVFPGINTEIYLIGRYGVGPSLSWRQ